MVGETVAKKAAGVFGSSSRASREPIDKEKALSEAELLDWWCAVDPHQAPQCVWIGEQTSDI